MVFNIAAMEVMKLLPLTSTFFVTVLCTAKMGGMSCFVAKPKTLLELVQICQFISASCGHVKIRVDAYQSGKNVMAKQIALTLAMNG